MRLLLNNPKLATRSCRDCQKWVYIEEGERRGEIAHRRGRPVPRGNSLPPCKTCEKKSPEEAWQYEPSYKALKLIDLYWQSQASPVQVDDTTRHYMGIVARVIKDYELELQMNLFSSLLRASMV